MKHLCGVLIGSICPPTSSSCARGACPRRAGRACARSSSWRGACARDIASVSHKGVCGCRAVRWRDGVRKTCVRLVIGGAARCWHAWTSFRAASRACHATQQTSGRVPWGYGGRTSITVKPCKNSSTTCRRRHAVLSYHAKDGLGHVQARADDRDHHLLRPPSAPKRPSRRTVCSLPGRPDVESS